jgi:hypothetical protein
MIDAVGDIQLIDWGDCGYSDPSDDFHAMTDLLTFAIDEPSTWNQWTNK